MAKAITVNGNAAVTGKTASLTVLGSDDGGETKLKYNWSVTVSPAGGAATFSVNGSNAAKNTTATFTKAGTYTLAVRIVDAGGLSVSSTARAVVTQVAALANLVQSVDADGSISRQDMLQILRSVGADNVVDTTEFTDLKQILYQATTLNIAGYVQTLAGDVINGSMANVSYQGQALGNLVAGSSATLLNKLISKWFLGADHPALCNTSLVHTSTAGSLFPHTPSHTDEYQGGLGDCYFISAMGTLADSSPAAVQNMFIDNGDGTFTVRPWGTNQPGPLKWSQLQSTCSQLAVADTAGSVPISGVSSKAAAASSLFSGRAPDLLAGLSPTESAAAVLWESSLARAAACAGQISAATNASRELFAIWGSSREAGWDETSLASPAHGILPAACADATFAADGLLPGSDVLAAAV